MRKILSKRKKYWTALLCVLLLLGSSPAAVYAYGERYSSSLVRAGATNAVDPEQLTATLECGWKGMCGGNNQVPATVTLTNNGPEFHGTLKLRVSLNSDISGYDVAARFLEQLFVGVRSAISERNQTYTYELPVEIPQNGTVQKELTLSLIAINSTFVTISLEDQNGTVVFENMETVTTRNIFQNEIVVAVLEAEDGGCASRINGTEVGDLSYALHAVSIRPEELTEEMALAGAPDILILLDYSRGMLEEEQRKNLERWEANGGISIELKGEFFSDIDPSGAAGATMEQVFRRDPAKVMQILFPEDVVSKLPSVMSGMYLDSYDSAMLLEDKPIRRQPSSVLFIVLIVGYAVLAGPVLYLALRKRNRRYYLWAGICAMSVVFVLVITLLGRATTMNAPVIVYQNVLNQNGAVLEEKLDFEIQAPYNSGYTVYLDPSYRMSPAMAMNYSPTETEGTAGMGYEQISLAYGETKNRISISNQSSFALNAFTLSREKTPETEGLVSDLRWKDKKISGTVSNQTGFALENCILMLPGHMVSLGALEQGEVLELDGLETESVRESYEWLRQRFDDTDLLENYSTQIDFWNLNRLEDSMLIAQVQDWEASFQLYSGYETVGTVLYTARAAVSNVDENGVVYCPYAQQYYSTEQIPFSYSNCPGSLIMSGQQMEVTYYLNALFEESDLRRQCLAMLVQEIFTSPEMVAAMDDGLISGNLEYIRSMMEEPQEVLSMQNKRIVSIAFERLDVHSEDWKCFSGAIEVYNYSTGVYEELEDWTLTDVAAKRGIPSPYLRNGNQLRVRYTLAEEEIASSQYEYTGSFLMPDLVVTAVNGT